MSDFTGNAAHRFPQQPSQDQLARINEALKARGAPTDATHQSFSPGKDVPTRYTFTCLLDTTDQMAADATSEIILRRALSDCGLLTV